MGASVRVRDTREQEWAVLLNKRVMSLRERFDRLISIAVVALVGNALVLDQQETWVKKVRNYGVSNQHRTVDVFTHQLAMKQKSIDDSVFPPLSSFLVHGCYIPFGAIKPVHSSLTSYARVTDPLRRLRLRDHLLLPLVRLRAFVKDFCRY